VVIFDMKPMVESLFLLPGATPRMLIVAQPFLSTDRANRGIAPKT
jgi:hypothetical protein